jgi:hypothetical protein
LSNHSRIYITIHKENRMPSFDLHTIETAPEESRPLLENSQKSFGRIPGLHAVMAEAPALLEAYQQLHQLRARP